MKKIIKIILVIAIVISTVFVMGRYGWKLTGFKLCQNSLIYDVQVDENRVTMKGRDANFIPRGFVGYYYEIEDNCLYIGFSVVHIDSWGCFCGNLVLVTIFFVFVEDSL